MSANPITSDIIFCYGNTDVTIFKPFLNSSSNGWNGGIRFQNRNAANNVPLLDLNHIIKELQYVRYTQTNGTASTRASVQTMLNNLQLTKTPGLVQESYWPLTGFSFSPSANIYGFISFDKVMSVYATMFSGGGALGDVTQANVSNNNVQFEMIAYGIPLVPIVLVETARAILNSTNANGNAASSDYRPAVGKPAVNYVAGTPKVGTAASSDYQPAGAQVGVVGDSNYKAATTKVGTAASLDYKAAIPATGTPASPDYEPAVGTAASVGYVAAQPSMVQITFSVGGPLTVEYLKKMISNNPNIDTSYWTTLVNNTLDAYILANPQYSQVRAIANEQATFNSGNIIQPDNALTVNSKSANTYVVFSDRTGGGLNSKSFSTNVVNATVSANQVLTLPYVAHHTYTLSSFSSNDAGMSPEIFTAMHSSVPLLSNLIVSSLPVVNGISVTANYPLITVGYRVYVSIVYNGIIMGSATLTTGAPSSTFAILDPSLAQFVPINMKAMISFINQPTIVNGVIVPQSDNVTYAFVATPGASSGSADINLINNKIVTLVDGVRATTCLFTDIVSVMKTDTVPTYIVLGVIFVGSACNFYGLLPKNSSIIAWFDLNGTKITTFPIAGGNKEATLMLAVFNDNPNGVTNANPTRVIAALAPATAKLSVVEGVVVGGWSKSTLIIVDPPSALESMTISVPVTTPGLNGATLTFVVATVALATDRWDSVTIALYQIKSTSTDKTALNLLQPDGTYGVSLTVPSNNSSALIASLISNNVPPQASLAVVAYTSVIDGLNGPVKSLPLFSYYNPGVETAIYNFVYDAAADTVTMESSQQYSAVLWQRAPDDGNAGLYETDIGNGVYNATTKLFVHIFNLPVGGTPIVAWASSTPFGFDYPPTPPDVNEWQSVTYGNNLFVAVSREGPNKVVTSGDGTDWVYRSVPEASDVNYWQSVTYGNNIFVAVSREGPNKVMTSHNGIDWVYRSVPEAPNVKYWQSVTYGNNLFVAVSLDGDTGVMTSHNGIDWVYRSVPLPNDINYWQSVTYGNNLFVAVSTQGPNKVMISDNGIEWEYQLNTIPSDVTYWQSVTYGNNLFVAVSSQGPNKVMTSFNGIDWVYRSVPGNGMNGWQSVTYGNNLFVAVSSFGPDKVMTSDDGIEWVYRSFPGDVVGGWQSVTYGNNIFVAVSNQGTQRVMTSEDGIEWELEQTQRQNHIDIHASH